MNSLKDKGRRELRARDIAVLCRAWDEGKASGRAGELDIPRLIAEEKRRFRHAVAEDV
jgi:hypothetical protein